MALIEFNISPHLEGLAQLNAAVGKVTQSFDNSTNSLTVFHEKLARLSSIANLDIMGRGIASVGTAIGSVVRTGFGAARGLFSFADSIATTGDAIAKNARMLGLTGGYYQALGYAAARSGVENDQLTASLKKFSVNVGKAAGGNKELTSLFSALGINVYKANGILKDNKDLLLETANAFPKLSSAQDKALVATSLFGKSGMDMIKMLGDGGGELDKLTRRFYILGGGIPDDALKNSEEFKDALDDMNVAVFSLKGMFAKELLPSLVEFFKQLGQSISEHKGEIRDAIGKLTKAVPKIADSVIKHLPGMIKGIGTLADWFARLAQFVGPIKAALLPIAVVVFPAVIQGVFGLVTALSGLFKFFGSLYKAGKWLFVFFKWILPIMKDVAVAIGLLDAPVLAVIAGIAAVIAVVVILYKNWDTVSAFFRKTLDAICGALKNVARFFGNDFVPDFKAGIRSITGFLGGLVKSIAGFFKSIFHRAVDGFFSIADGLKRVFTGVKDFVVGIFRDVVGFYLGVLDKVSGKLMDIPGIGRPFAAVHAGTEALLGSDFFSDSPADGGALRQSVQNVSETRNVTTTQRFAVDFSGMPRGVTVTPPAKGGDYDFSTGYLFGGGF